MTNAAQSFSRRVMHQFRTEVRHQHLTVLFWVVWLGLRLWQRNGHILGRNDATLAPFIELITACIAMGLVHRCVHADAPANPETGSLTRPVGRGALMLGKAVFLGVGVLVPFTVAESVLWGGFGHDGVQCLALAAGVLLAGGFVLTLAFVISASSRTGVQALGLGLCVLVLGGAMTLVVPSLEKHGMPWLNSLFESTMLLRTSGGILAAVVALVLCGMGGWLCFVPRRRGWALLVVLGAFAQEPLTTSMRQHDGFRAYDWRQLPEERYNGVLTLHAGADAGNEKGRVQTLWPTLRLSGLREDEAASIIAFAPVGPPTGNERWPAAVFYTDTPLGAGRGDAWANSDDVRVLMRQSLAGTLWLQGNHSRYSDRRWLENDFKSFRLDWHVPQTQRWRLRLAIRAVKPIATLPLRELWDVPQSFLLRPGLRLGCETFTDRYTSRGTWNLRGQLHRSLSALLPEGRHERSAAADGRPPHTAIMLVLHDAELREATEYNLRFSTPGSPSNAPSYDRSYAWQIDTETGFHVQVDEPSAQYELLHTTRADWIARTTASFYVLEERGGMDLELSAEEMTRVLAEAMAQAKAQAQAEVKKP